MNLILIDLWQNILVLFILVVLTFSAYILMVRQRHKRAITFGNMRTLQKVHGAKIFDASPMILVFKLVIVFLIFLVATGSVQIFNKAPLPDRDYIFMMDSSSSMANDDIDPSRIEAAREIADDWLAIAQKESNIGLISFSDEIEIEAPPTRDLGAISDAMEDIQINYSKSGTSLEYALNYAYEMVVKNDAKNTSLLLFTDTSEDVGEETIEKLNRMNIEVIYFAIGSDNWTIDSDIPGFEDQRVLSFNYTQVEDLAGSTGGEAYRVQSAEDFMEAYDDATLITREMRMKSDLYILLLVGLLSIAELVLYARFGGL